MSQRWNGIAWISSQRLRFYFHRLKWLRENAPDNAVILGRQLRLRGLSVHRPDFGPYRHILPCWVGAVIKVNGCGTMNRDAVSGY
ncbi:MAG: hypothetical protein H6632_13015 [Anaerolineales bacterium]|nr:hypothetical protein [Anaerolineales bacterium]